MSFNRGIFVALALLYSSQSQSSVSDVDKQQLAANYMRAAQEYAGDESARVYRKKATHLATELGMTIAPSTPDVGEFKALKKDAFIYFCNFLTIQSMACLERSSLGLQRRINEIIPNWAVVKMARIPHQLNFSWGHLLQDRIAAVEAQIASLQVNQIGGATSEESALLRRMRSLSGLQAGEIRQQAAEPVALETVMTKSKLEDTLKNLVESRDPRGLEVIYIGLRCAAIEAERDWQHELTVYCGEPKSCDLLDKSVASSKAVYEFLDPLVAEGNLTAIRLKVQALLNDTVTWSHQPRPDEAYALARKWLVVPTLEM